MTNRTILARVAPLALLALTLGCEEPASGRPTVALTAAERTPDPACTGDWVAAVTVRVVDDQGRAVANARSQPCLIYGPDNAGTCLEGAVTNAQGWAVVRLAEELRCLHRAVIKVSVPGPYAASYQRLELTPTRAVLDVPGSVTLQRVAPAVRTPPLGTPTAPHTVEFEQGIMVTLIPDALDTPADYSNLGLALLRGADAPEFKHQMGEPSIVLAFGPDNELNATGGMSRWGNIAMPAPSDAIEGTTYDAYVLAGVFTEQGTTVLEEGALHRFASPVVTDGQLSFPLPRVGWIALRRR